MIFRGFNFLASMVYNMSERVLLSSMADMQHAIEFPSGLQLILFGSPLSASALVILLDLTSQILKELSPPELNSSGFEGFQHKP